MQDLLLFFDGCHKIYYAQASDTATIDQMKEYGYEVTDGDFSKNLDDAWQVSCSLKFVEPANLDFAQPHISQFQKSGDLHGLKTQLKEYFKGAK